MWGNIVTESIFQTNYNISFVNTRADVLINLTCWQYWWWFWFGFLWSLYFSIFARIIRFRVFEFLPKIASSQRPRGKWGDLLIVLIPISWCANILINSNFLLKMLEWQTECNLFTVRIRGKQWYWIYKFDPRAVIDIASAPKNVGHNKWLVNTFGEHHVSNDYFSIMRLRFEDNALKKYWIDHLDKMIRVRRFSLPAGAEDIKLQEVYYENGKKKIRYFLIKSSSDFLVKEKLSSFKLRNGLKNLNLFYGDKFFGDNLKYFRGFWFYLENGQKKNKMKLQELKPLNFFSNLTNSFTQLEIFKIKHKKEFFNMYDLLLYTFYEISEADMIRHIQLPNTKDNTRYFKIPEAPRELLRIIKLPEAYKTIDEKELSMVWKIFKIRYNPNSKKNLEKPSALDKSLVIKQKRYTRKKAIGDIIDYFRKQTNFSFNYFKHLMTQNVDYKKQLVVKSWYNNTKNYKIVKKSRFRAEDITILTNKRLLRAARTLVLPLYVNVTVITNSYDVIHSWFIPGLGVKFDCIPGRSTHHTLSVDEVGFFYGQCAEICGRYHHHMPVRLCSLPFDHFLVWWYNYGIPKMVFGIEKYITDDNFPTYKFAW